MYPTPTPTPTVDWLFSPPADVCGLRRRWVFTFGLSETRWQVTFVADLMLHALFIVWTGYPVSPPPPIPPPPFLPLPIASLGFTVWEREGKRPCTAAVRCTFLTFCYLKPGVGQKWQILPCALPATGNFVLVQISVRPVHSPSIFRTISLLLSALVLAYATFCFWFSDLSFELI